MWTPLHLGSVHFLADFFRANEYLLSDYSLPSLLAWNSLNNQILFQVYDDVLLLCVKNKDGVIRYLLLPLYMEKQPLNKRPLDGEWLKEIANAVHCPRFGSVPEPLLMESILSVFDCCEDEQNANYIYLAEALASLKGNRFAAKRNHINNFIKRFPSQKLLVEPITAATAGECMECLQYWREEKIASAAATSSSLFEECAGVASALNSIDELPWLSVLVRIDGVVCAFAIGSRLTEDSVVLNFEKALSSYRGLYQFLDREFARLVVAAGCRYINKESDMGLINLRASKESYHPQEKLRSFFLLLK